MLGDQKVRPWYRWCEPARTYSWYLARASSEMTPAMRNMSESSQVAARPMAWGNEVASPERATPCSASFHQLYSGIPSRSIAGATSCICDTFSSSVMRDTRSSTRRPNGRARFK